MFSGLLNVSSFEINLGGSAAVNIDAVPTVLAATRAALANSGGSTFVVPASTVVAADMYGTNDRNISVS
jgi:stage V sporulation protein SpoVS